MNTILVSDVFGKTPGLIELSEELAADVIVDPYGGRDMFFKNENEAYSYFRKNVGIDAYLSVLERCINSISITTLLIGFSVGASVIWRLSDSPPNQNVRRGICYYGSQIRNFTAVDPKFDIELLYPSNEPHFDIKALQAALTEKANVKHISLDYLHGFMNRHSDNYEATAYSDQVRRLKSSIG